MASSFFWYDLETSGVSPRDSRIMQFAGQRTDIDLNIIGDPVNVLVRLSDDILPDPDAILLTGITPQKTLSEGITEVEFLKLFHKEVAIPGTIFIGFNSIRFDDEFMRYLNYRNFYDAYQWQWKDDRSRWDLLDVVRMTRALRPAGIKWPFDSSGKPTNRLELLTSVNKLDHSDAHDALSDVYACIEVARLIKDKQPKLFNYLLAMRDKKKVSDLVGTQLPFVYTTGKYSSQFEKTSVAVQLAPHTKRAASLVYDLRHDPTPFLSLTVAELVSRWKWTKDEKAPARLPVKTLRHNVCPAVAPLSVLDDESCDRLEIDMVKVETHHKLLQDNPQFTDKVLQALELLDKQQQTSAFSDQLDVDGQLYDGFFDSGDAQNLTLVQHAKPNELTNLIQKFHDSRLQQLLPLYKARNFPKELTDEERMAWEKFRQHKLMDGGEKSRLARFASRMQQLASTSQGQDKRYILEELQLYAESIIPIDVDA